MIYFTSDQHYYHENVIKYCGRPYKSVEEMNEMLILNWNNTVHPDDTVYIIGDFSLALRPIEIIAHRLVGTKYLIPGNHDWCHPYNKKSRKEGQLEHWTNKYKSHGLEVLPLDHTLEIPGVATVNMNHMPYDIEDSRYQKYKPKDDGRWLLCGHVHEKWKIKNKMINVGVDVWDYKPVSIEEIKKIILGA